VSSFEEVLGGKIGLAHGYLGVWMRVKADVFACCLVWFSLRRDEEMRNAKATKTKIYRLRANGRIINRAILRVGMICSSAGLEKRYGRARSFIGMVSGVLING
jgi:hypothetical protein